jgi:hypothetical protein
MKTADTAASPPLGTPASFGPQDERALWDAFDADPKKALSLAITGLHRLQEQVQHARQATAPAVVPAQLDKETVLRLRKELPLSLEPWGETLGFAHAVQTEVNLVWQKILRSR